MYELSGDVMGELDESELDGMELVGAARARAAQHHPRRPKWRNRLAAGVPAPGYGVVNIPLRPQSDAGVFSPTAQFITFLARPQKPFRGERLLTTVRRSTGATGTIIFSSGVFVGTDLQQGSIGSFDIENYTKDAFGVRFVMVQAEPGVEITMDCSAQPAVPADETAACAIQIIGRYVH